MSLQALDRDHPVDRHRREYTTITVRVRDRRRPGTMTRDERRPLRVDHDVHRDPDATPGRQRLGLAY